ncbi:uncharacterized protein TNCV_285511 [Trichonephila clavipes]|nr:uncharacterized protein TNCV_285511 [Trichonephila clavipes]
MPVLPKRRQQVKPPQVNSPALLQQVHGILDVLIWARTITRQLLASVLQSGHPSRYQFSQALASGVAENIRPPCKVSFWAPSRILQSVIKTGISQALAPRILPPAMRGLRGYDFLDGNSISRCVRSNIVLLELPRFFEMHDGNDWVLEIGQKACVTVTVRLVPTLIRDPTSSTDPPYHLEPLPVISSLLTFNGDRYRAINTNFFIPELNNHDVQELGFQQDGATCHTARATIDLLKDTFGDRLISRFGPVNWPPRSFDLTPLDYFLWGYVKSLVYADKPQTLDHLEDNIRRVIAAQILEKVIVNWTSRLDYIRASRGSHMPEIRFKIPVPLRPTADHQIVMDVNFMPGDVSDKPYFQGLIPLQIYRVNYLGLLHIKWDFSSNSPHDRGCRKIMVVVTNSWSVLSRQEFELCYERPSLKSGKAVAKFSTAQTPAMLHWAILNENPSCVPGAPRKAAVAHFKLLTGLDCLRSHLHRGPGFLLKNIGIADSLNCAAKSNAVCVTETVGQPMTIERLKT